MWAAALGVHAVLLFDTYFLYEHPQKYFMFIKSFWLSLKNPSFSQRASVYAPLNCHALGILKHNPVKHPYKASLFLSLSLMQTHTVGQWKAQGGR